MRLVPILLAAAFVTGCATVGGPEAPESRGPGRPGGLGADPAHARIVAPLVLEPSDISLGTTIEFHRLPTLGDLHDVERVLGARHVLVMLPEWPAPGADLSAFRLLPEGCDAIVVLPDYPPDHAALDQWNFATGPIRIVLVVFGPPGSNAILDDLNRMRYLERVVARMDEPSRAGFERLQRPLSFVTSAG
jgi:hypothetical protein